MLYRFDLIEQRVDEDVLLFLIKDLAEDAINHVTSHPFTPPRLQPSDVHVFFEKAGEDGSRTWLVTINHGDRFLVQVSLDRNLAERHAQVLQWETGLHAMSVFYLKQQPTQQEQQMLPEVYTNGPFQEGPIGHARLVGYTQEQLPRPVYWLYEGQFDSSSKRISSQFRGSYLLIERRFIHLPLSLEWHLVHAGGTKQ